MGAAHLRVLVNCSPGHLLRPRPGPGAAALTSPSGCHTRATSGRGQGAPLLTPQLLGRPPKEGLVPIVCIAEEAEPRLGIFLWKQTTKIKLQKGGNNYEF